MTKLRWGILSTARIGLKKVIPAIQRSELGMVTAIASRRHEAATEAASELGIASAHGSYEDLLGDPYVDAVYIPLPNHLHVPWAMKALEAGKHVLCEKPIALSSAEAEALTEAAARHPELKVMEAFMYRFHPQWIWAKAWVDEGRIGTLRAIQATFTYFNADPTNIRNQADMGGGGLMDIGCYPISAARWFMDAEPKRVCAVLDFDPAFHTDRLATAILDFGGGATAAFTCSTQLHRSQRVELIGTEGHIVVERPFNAPPDAPCTLWLHEGDQTHEIHTAVVDQYTAQADAFARAVRDDLPVPTPLSDAVANMRVIERLQESARVGGWA